MWDKPIIASTVLPIATTSSSRKVSKVLLDDRCLFIISQYFPFLLLR